jgi:hypothetical protein
MATPRQDPTRGRSIASDDLSTRIKASGMIQPGAHAAEYDKPTPLEKMGDWFNKTFGAKHVPMAQPKVGPLPVMSEATEDSLSKKYLGR